ncbi:MAG: NAD(P)-binding domain-containing protein [Candidatus Taylorbacteria bacterium]|nr:NAD(P)-binding domain-containing protein [Candidatus Taylorbacteria bacterium]
MSQMENKKITFFEAGESEEKCLREELQKSSELRGFEPEFINQKLNKSTVRMAVDSGIVSVFINSTVNKDIIEDLPKTKLLVTRSTGFDHINLACAAKKGLKVSNVPAYGSRTVAEYAFALILGLSRKTLEASHRIKEDHSFDVYGLMGFNLQGKTLGIVGTGRIGQNVAKIARGFDMNVIAYDTFPNNAAATEIGFKYVSLDELLAQSDIVTLHVPYCKDTHHLINKDNISKFKRGALLINTARGEVCDTEAIIMGVEKKILGGVGLDVVEGERNLKEESGKLFTRLTDPVLHPEQAKRLSDYRKLMRMPEVFITPHIAYYTIEAQNEIVKTTIENISAFLRGEEKNIIK